jgi:hypothetical protein
VSEPKKPEDMTDEELYAATLAELSGQVAQHDDQPRDDQGRFTKPAEEEVVYQRTIDLGDGAGVQVFEGATLEELVDKLAKAQENATRKIREQAAAIKAQPAPLPVVETEKPLTPEEQWLLQQRMLADPTSVINEYVQKEVQKIESAREQAAREEREAIAAGDAAAKAWVAANPDYYASDKNGNKIKKFLEINGLDISPENLTVAFNDLSESGLLEARPAEATNAKTDDELAAPVTRRIVEPVAPAVTTVRRKVVGGISTKRQAPVEQSAPGLTEEQLLKMPLDQLEQLMYQQARRG